MKLRRFAAIALPVAALAAFGLPFAANAASSHQAAAHSAHAAHSARTTVAVYNCINQPQVRPKTFDIFCDGSGAYTDLDWTSWNATMATATGVEWIDNCEPNCAAGKWSHTSVDVIFWRSLPVKGHPGERGYTRITTLVPSQSRVNDAYTSVPPGVFPGEF
jgi:hypothetical protein